MGSSTLSSIPLIDLSKSMVPGTEAWRRTCEKMREAGERLGCFMVAGYDMPAGLVEDAFGAARQLFDLPTETKRRNTSHKPYCGYEGRTEVIPLFESLGIEDVDQPEAALRFTNLMWPEGNQSFCKVINRFGQELLTLGNLIQRMILESYGLEALVRSHIDESHCIMRLMNYEAAAADGSNSSPAVGLCNHTDKNWLTVLCQQGVEGLQVESKQRGDWAHVPFIPSTFVVIIGDSLMAWSNGRLHSPTHRVMVFDKERFSIGLFSTPKDGAIIKVPEQLVDDGHALLFNPFNFSDFLYYFSTTGVKLSESAIHVFAGSHD
ncbi:probable 2-oxoglutarate-dependent dioxygenase AOP1 [Nymphaea colorata]|nr:probable 2-oxoglutarate-dependent dioxygenase AOP1 [Nymphaea colorata]